jgi:hypothetical protein
MDLRSKFTAVACVVALAVGFTGCSSEPEAVQSRDLGDRFESSNPTDNFLDDGSGNELEVGTDLPLPANWPQGVPTPNGTLIAVSVIDKRTAVATWTVQGDVFTTQEGFLSEFDSTFTVEPLADLSTDTIAVYGVIGNGYDITVSATLGERSSDPGEITLLVNPSL